MFRYGCPVTGNGRIIARQGISRVQDLRTLRREVHLALRGINDLNLVSPVTVRHERPRADRRLLKFQSRFFLADR